MIRDRLLAHGSHTRLRASRPRRDLRDMTFVPWSTSRDR